MFNCKISVLEVCFVEEKLARCFPTLKKKLYSYSGTVKNIVVALGPVWHTSKKLRCQKA